MYVPTYLLLIVSDTSLTREVKSIMYMRRLYAIKLHSKLPFANIIDKHLAYVYTHTFISKQRMASDV